MSAPRPGARQRRLGQNFLRDPNLLDAIVRDSGVGADDVVLEVGGGGGALTERLAPAVSHLHVVELDERLRPELSGLAERLGNVELHWGDAMRLDLAALAPVPVAIVSNLPYSVATPLLLRTIETLPAVQDWTVMVQLEIAERLAAGPGSKTYGSPSVMAQLACEVELVRRVDRAVFNPRPRVDSAIVRLRRRGPTPATTCAGSFAAASPTAARRCRAPWPWPSPSFGRDRVRAALADAGLPEDARAESLSPEDFRSLAAKLGAR